MYVLKRKYIKQLRKSQKMKHWTQAIILHLILHTSFILMIAKNRPLKSLSLSWSFTSHATKFMSYMCRHRCAGGLKKLSEEKWWGTVDSNRQLLDQRPATLITALFRMIWRAGFNFYLHCTEQYMPKIFLACIKEYPH